MTGLFPRALGAKAVKAAMTADRNSLEADLIRFVRLRGDRYAGVTSLTDLIESGLLDSLLLLDLILHIEELCGIQFESDQIDPSNFRTVSAIVDVVMGQLSATQQ